MEMQQHDTPVIVTQVSTLCEISHANNLLAPVNRAQLTTVNESCNYTITNTELQMITKR